MKHLTAEVLTQHMKEAYEFFMDPVLLTKDAEIFKSLCTTASRNPDCLHFIMEMMVGNDPATPMCIFHYGLQIGYLMHQLQSKESIVVRELENIYNAESGV